MTSGSPVVAAVGTAPADGGASSSDQSPPASAPEFSAPATGLSSLGPPYDQYITSDFLGPGPLLAGRKIYLIVLNYCLPAGLLHVWPLASFRICADGGCNRLYDELPSMMPPPPEEIVALEALAEEDAGATAGAAAAPATGTQARELTTSSAAIGSAVSPQGNGHSIIDSSSSSSSRSSGHDVDSDPHPSTQNGCAHANSQQQHQHHLGAAGTGLAPADFASSLRLAYLPDVVLGDLDSLRPDIRQYYVLHGVPFMDMSYDQDTNDLAKAISLIEERFIRPDPEHSPDRHQILVLGALGGRLDHTLANLNVLHMFPHLNVTLWGDGNLVRLVRPGKALITPDERFEGPTCGLIPIAGPVTATSSGLQWNVAATQLRVGGLVSSSNLLTGASIEVAADGPLLWSTEVRQEPRPDLRTLWIRTAAAAAAVRKREAQDAAAGASAAASGAVGAVVAEAVPAVAGDAVAV